MFVSSQEMKVEGIYLKIQTRTQWAGFECKSAWLQRRSLFHCIFAGKQLMWKPAGKAVQKSSLTGALRRAFSHLSYPPPSSLCFTASVLSLLACLFTSALSEWLPLPHFLSRTHSFSKLCILLLCSRICWPPGSKALSLTFLPLSQYPNHTLNCKMCRSSCTAEHCQEKYLNSLNRMSYIYNLQNEGD